MHRSSNDPFSPPSHWQSDLYLSSAQSAANSQAAFIKNLTIGYTVSFSALVILLLLPRVSRLSRQLRQRQSLLLLIPPEVVLGLPDVKELVMEAIAEAEQGEAGVAARRKAALAGGGAGGSGGFGATRRAV